MTRVSALPNQIGKGEKIDLQKWWKDQQAEEKIIQTRRAGGQTSDGKIILGKRNKPDNDPV